MAGELQGHQLVVEVTQSNLDTGTRADMDTLIAAIDSRAAKPLKITADGTVVITIGSSGPFTLNNGKEVTFPPLDGNAIEHASETLNVITGTFSGTGTSYAPPAIGNNLFVALVLQIDSNSIVSALFGTPNASAAVAKSAANLPTFSTTDSSIGYVVLGTDGGGIYQLVNQTDVTEFPTGGAGGGGGGGASALPDNEQVTGQTGFTITFVKTYTFEDKVGFYRNGVRMRLVSVFSVGAENYSDEYQQVDNGASSTDITLHGSHPAVVDDWWMIDFGTPASAITTLPEVVVGSPAQVISGVADYDSLQTAIDNYVAGEWIKYLGGAINEVITLNKAVSIFGIGKDALIEGIINVTSGTGDESSIQHCKFADDVTLLAGVKNTIITNNWIAVGKDITDSSGNLENLYSFNLKEI